MSIAAYAQREKRIPAQLRHGTQQELHSQSGRRSLPAVRDRAAVPYRFTRRHAAGFLRRGGRVQESCPCEGDNGRNKRYGRRGLKGCFGRREEIKGENVIPGSGSFPEPVILE